MATRMKDRESGTASRNAGCVKSVVGVGLCLALGGLAGIVVGLVAGVGSAMILGGL